MCNHDTHNAHPANCVCARCTPLACTCDSDPDARCPTHAMRRAHMSRVHVAPVEYNDHVITFIAEGWHTQAFRNWVASHT